MQLYSTFSGLAICEVRRGHCETANSIWRLARLEPRIGNPWLKLRSALGHWGQALRGLFGFRRRIPFGDLSKINLDFAQMRCYNECKMSRDRSSYSQCYKLSAPAG